MAPVPERLTQICAGQKPTDVEIKGSGVSPFLSACTGYGNTGIIKSQTVRCINSADRDNYQPLNLSHEGCEMTIDALETCILKLKQTASRLMMGIYT